MNFSIDTPEEALFQKYGMELRQEVEDHLEGKLSVVVEVVPYVAEDVEAMAHPTPSPTQMCIRDRARVDASTARAIHSRETARNNRSL